MPLEIAEIIASSKVVHGMNARVKDHAILNGHRSAAAVALRGLSETFEGRP